MTIEAEMKKVAVDLRVKPDDYNDFSILLLYTVFYIRRCRRIEWTTGYI